MTSKDITLFGIALLLIIGGLIWAYYTLLPNLFMLPIMQPPASQPPKEEEIVPPPATGDVNDAAAAILQELPDEDALLSEEENDASFVTSDSQEISDFGQSVNENEL